MTFLKPAATVLLASLLVACQSGTDTTTSRYAYCGKGQAPSGELTARRIPSANTDQPGLYEGPVWRDGALYFSRMSFTEGFPSDVMKLVDGQVSVAIADAGTNGLALDGQGRLLAGTHKYKAVSRFELPSGERETVVAEYEGDVFNSPNDLTQSADGVLYFSDPDFQRAAAPGGQDATRVYRVQNGEITVVDDTIANPNGVSLSPDQSRLYVAGGGQDGYLKVYDITDEGVGPGRVLVDPVTVPDGMAVDCQGNLYVTEHTEQRVRVISPEGEQLATIAVDANITNAAFGGPERRTLYLTGAGAVWQIELDVAGLPY